MLLVCCASCYWGVSKMYYLQFEIGTLLFRLLRSHFLTIQLGEGSRLGYSVRKAIGVDTGILHLKEGNQCHCPLICYFIRPKFSSSLTGFVVTPLGVVYLVFN